MDKPGGFFGLTIGKAFPDSAEKQRRTPKRATAKSPTKRRATRTSAKRKK